MQRELLNPLVPVALVELVAVRRVAEESGAVAHLRADRLVELPVSARAELVPVGTGEAASAGSAAVAAAAAAHRGGRSRSAAVCGGARDEPVEDGRLPHGRAGDGGEGCRPHAGRRAAGARGWAATALAVGRAAGELVSALRDGSLEAAVLAAASSCIVVATAVRPKPPAASSAASVATTASGTAGTSTARSTWPAAGTSMTRAAVESAAAWSTRSSSVASCSKCSRSPRPARRSGMSWPSSREGSVSASRPPRPSSSAVAAAVSVS